MNQKRISILIPLLVIGHLLSALYYLSFPVDIKYSQDIAFVLSKPVTYESAFSLWFFSTEFTLCGIIMAFSSREGKTYWEKNFITVEYVHLIFRGIIYGLHYSEILTTNSRQRMSYLILYMFLASIYTLYKSTIKEK